MAGDGDTGYGNVNNVQRTVKGYAQAGFAGILIEDQVSPKSCGHVRGKIVVGRKEALSRISAAVDGRNEGQDIVIVGRTDARQAESLDEALWRAAAFADAGVDILFIDALESVEEMKAFCKVSLYLFCLSHPVHSFSSVFICMYSLPLFLRKPKCC